MEYGSCSRWGYGGMSVINDKDVAGLSYRDPNIVETAER